MSKIRCVSVQNKKMIKDRCAISCKFRVNAFICICDKEQHKQKKILTKINKNKQKKRKRRIVQEN